MTTRRFSGYLRELLEEKGMTVSGLARLTGVERTALSKVLAGQRVLPYGALDGLIYHLRLTPDEEGRLPEFDGRVKKDAGWRVDSDYTTCPFSGEASRRWLIRF